ncbi:MAG: hypothetical protein QXN87_07760 [Candidatus Bathyarchaeia archaeon]
MVNRKGLFSKPPIVQLLALALIVRLALAPFLSHPFDMRVFMAVGAAVSRGITPYSQYPLQLYFAETPHPHLYGTLPGIGYPPIWGLIEGLMFWLASAATPKNLYAIVLALKLPIILAELATAVLVYDIMKKLKGEKTGFRAFILFLFCPFLLAVGTVWGMFDILAFFFTLLSIKTLNGDWKVSSLHLSFASVLKVFPVILAPLYSLYLYKRDQDVKKAILFLLSTIVFTLILTIVPMLVFGWPLSNLYNALAYHVTTTGSPYEGVASFPYGAASIFNVFTLLSGLSRGSVQPPNLAVYLWIPASIAVYALFMKISNFEGLCSKRRQANRSFALIFKWSMLLMLTFFTVRVWVSEQNLVFLFGFFALYAFMGNPVDFGRIHLFWILFFAFVMVHVPVLGFFWLPYPWALNLASDFADGSYGWTRLLSMSILTFCWLALMWHYTVRKVGWRFENSHTSTS